MLINFSKFMKDFLNPIIKVLHQSFEQLLYIISNEQEFKVFLINRGWVANISNSDIPTIQSAFNVLNDIEDLRELIEDLKGGNPNSLQKLTEAVDKIKSLFSLVDNLRNHSTSYSIFPLDQGDFWEEMADDVIDYFVINYLKVRRKVVFNILYFFGIIDFEEVDPAGSNRIKYTRGKLYWDKLADLLTRPETIVTQRYGWNVNNQNINSDKLFEVLEHIFVNSNSDARILPARENLYPTYYSNLSFSGNQYINELEIPIIENIDPFNNNLWGVGLFLAPITDTDTSSTVLSGLLIEPYVKGLTKFRFPIGKNIFIEAKGYFSSNGALKFELFPSKTKISTSLQDAIVNAKLSLIAAPARPYILIGSPLKSRLELNGIETSLELRGELNDPEFIFNLGQGEYIKTSNLKFVFEPGQGDSFIKKVLGAKPFMIDLGFVLRWSNKTGFGFVGNAGFTIEIPITRKKELSESKFGLHIDKLKIAANASQSGSNISFGIDATFKLGVITAVISDIGANVKLVPKASGQSRGLLNNLDLDWGFKPPSAIGLSIETPTVMGGGYLKIEPDKYAGIFELKFIEKVTVRILGILNTKLPGGKEGYSLLLLVFVEEFQPVQLGFGFTLNGVGGLLGLNRTANVEKLRSGVRDGSLKSTLFPTDVIKNANRIISDLESLYPASEGRFLIGPMAKIGWGSPQPLITIDLGLIIELPEPVTVVILGVIRAVLPEENNVLLKLQISFLGVIEFAKKSISFDASIDDSYLLTYKLFGDMAFRLNWGDQPNFLLTVGGFHPQFTPPPLNLPEIRRITVSIADLPKLKVSLETYFAVTTNTVQTGAKLYGRAEEGKFSAEAIFWFDVLIQFNPFYFIAEIGASAAIKRGGTTLLSAYLRLTVSGPKPWTVNGKVEFKVLGLKAEINVNESWNHGDNPSLPDEPVWPLLDKAIDDANNWRALLPERNTIAVSVKKVTTATGEVVVHPMGSFGFSQAVVPMDVTINKFGTVKPADYNRFWVHSAKDALNNSLTFTYLEDNFAPAQYRQMSDQDKLGEKSFQKFKSGMRLGTESLKSSYWVMRDVSHPVERIIDRRMKKDWDTVRPVDADLFNTMLRHNEVAKSPVSPVKNRLPYDAPTATAVGSNQYRVAHKNSLSPYDSLVFDNTSDAYNYLTNIVSSDPYQENKLFVIDTSEL